MTRILPAFAGFFTTFAVSLSLLVSASAQTTQNGPYYATPSWDQKLPTATRFVILDNWNSDAVLDRETGLVWTRSPSVGTANWVQAVQTCRATFAGNRGGWRLPTIEEFLALTDDSKSVLTTVFNVPVPSPGVPGFFSWTATSDEADSSNATALIVLGQGSSRSIAFQTLSKGAVTALVGWCVRGGVGHSSPNN